MILFSAPPPLPCEEEAGRGSLHFCSVATPSVLRFKIADRDRRPRLYNRRMADLKSPRLIYLKAVLFLIAGLTATVALFLDSPTLRTAALLAIAIWSFCRLYYFIFYVIEKYVDPGYKFAGLGAFLAYLVRRKRA